MKVSNKMLKFDYYVVHNGMISNDEELKKEHEKLGFAYTTKCMEYQSKFYNKFFIKCLSLNSLFKFSDSELL
jgi:hypothetical protein